MKHNVLSILLAAALVGGSLAACAPSGTSRSTGQFVDDATLTARAKAALAGAQDVNPLAINIETYRGEVSLTGFVDSKAEADRAVSAVQKVDGVRAVRNDMRIKPRQ